MVEEVFRFVSVRPVQQSGGPAPAGSGPLRLVLDATDSDFLAALRQHASPKERPKFNALVRAFVASPAFIRTRNQADPRLLALLKALAALPAQHFQKAADLAVQDAFDAGARELIDNGTFLGLLRPVADSIVAAAFEHHQGAPTRHVLAGLASALAVIVALANPDGRGFDKADFHATTLILPAGLFPLPQGDGSLSSLRVAQRTERERRRKAALAQLEARAGAIASGHAAITELLDAIASPIAVDPAPKGRGRRTAPARGTNPFVLDTAVRDRLSERTRTTLARVGITDTVDAARAVSLIEAHLVAVAAEGVRTAGTSRMVRIGGIVLPSDLIPDAVLDPKPDSARNPGPCTPAPIDPQPDPDDDVTAPSGYGEARILGMADLMLVEQELARYELGEIAHIENVLRTEKRERRFRTAMTTEETVSTETETVEEKEKDLASTERFELQNESQKVITENAAKEAGLTIHASYGPTVDATAKLGYTSNTATQQSERSASSYARETTSRAVSRLQTRTMERRTVRTVREVEERNLHAFDNSTGADISGIYRFVDKIYRAQIVNYGKRLMLEFLVPEPAAFWRYALTKQPIEPVSFTNPEPPGYCLVDGRTFVPLQAADITPENYVFWAGKYGAEDVTAPPPLTRVVSAAKKGPESFQTLGTNSNAPKVWSDTFEIDIPDGYLPAFAIVNAYGETQAGAHKLVIQVQAQQFFYVEPVDDGFQLALRVEPTEKVPVSVNTLRFHNYELLVNVFCTLSREALEQWQLKTFFAIQKAYEAAKARYDNSIESARIQAGFGQPMGRNPAENREIERVELKRACIAMATGQRFDTFDAMTRNVTPFGYPEIDFAEAKAEARWVQLFEQGFEWNNITYVFYPYFWGRKDGWLTLVQLRDDDALFTRFLQAGAARVQVPVRPGFETVVLNYLAGVEIWDADGQFITSDDEDDSALHLSIVEELKHQLGNEDVEGVGTVTLTSGSDIVTGVGTAFTPDDERRRIAFGTQRFVIKTVEAPDRIRLRSAYEGTSESGAGYALGPRLVGEPWEVRLPTNLVKLDDYAIA